MSPYLRGRTQHPARRTSAFTFVEAIIVISLMLLLGSVFYPALTRAVRTTFQVTSRAEIQSGLRFAIESISRDVHQAHAVLERTPQPGATLTLFRPSTQSVREPERLVELNRNDGSGLPHFPFSGAADGAPLPSDRKLLIDGQKVKYRHDVEARKLVRVVEHGRLAGTVEQIAGGRPAIAALAFQGDGSPAQESLVASNITTFETVAVMYGSEGFLSRAPDPPTSAVAVVVRLKGSVEPDKYDPAVEQEAVTKAWLARRFSQAQHPGAASALDEQTDF